MIRARISHLRNDRTLALLRRRAIADLSIRRPIELKDYEDLYFSSLALMRVRPTAPKPVVRVLLPLSIPDALFAGMRTAIVFAGLLAKQKDLPLVICHFDRPRSPERRAQLARLVADLTDLPVARVDVQPVWTTTSTHEDDIYIATFWETALAAQVASRTGVISRERVVYLVQDYEPEFYPGSTESALCKATYHAGFKMVVNSTPLARYLSAQEGLGESLPHVFRPELDLRGIERAARERVGSDALRVTFYGRPSNTRNSFQLGVASMRLAARRFEQAGVEARFVSVGEKHPNIQLNQGRVPSLGKLGWDEYFSRLAETDVMLSFQQTPHPSHPPLDTVASGAYAVMNDLARSRGSIGDRLLVADSDPVLIAEALVEAGTRVRDEGTLHALDDEFIRSLGRPLIEVLSDVAAEI